jgi:hypothetical protein
LTVYLVVGYVFPKFDDLKVKVTNMLFFDKTLQFISETYILLAVCAALNLFYFNFDTFGNAVNSLVAVVILVIVIGMPFFVRCFYGNRRNVNKIWNQEPDFMNKYGSIIKPLNMHRHGRRVLSYLYVGMARKLWLVYMIVFLQEEVYWSLIMVNFQSVLMVMVVGETKPFLRKYENHLELFNEFSTLVVNYHLMMFTNFVPDLDTREQIGQSLVYGTCLNLACNLGIIGRTSFILMLKKGQLSYLKYYKMKAYNKRQEQVRLAQEEQRERYI